MDYFFTLAIFMAVGAVLSMSLNLVMGYTGLVTVAHAGFMAVGAYASAIIAIRLGLDMMWAIVAGAIVAALVGVIVGLVTANASPDEFTLASFALQMVIIEIISRWASLTRGTYGLAGVPRPSVGGEPVYDVPLLAALMGIFTVVSVGVLFYLGRSQFGLALRGMRESDPSMRALGRNTTRLKVVAIVISALFAGVAGGMQATVIGFLAPETFGIMVSVIAIAYLVVGGQGNMFGALIGAVFLLAIPEVISHLDLVSSNLRGPVNQIVYGVILLLFITLRPNGMLPERPIVKMKRFLDRSGPSSGARAVSAPVVEPPVGSSADRNPQEAGSAR